MNRPVRTSVTGPSGSLDKSSFACQAQVEARAWWPSWKTIWLRWIASRIRFASATVRVKLFSQ